MRWKLLRRRLSISAPRMIVRSHLPWPLRWAFVAVMLGFSAALALWAFEFGREIAGLDRSAKEELAALRVEVMQLRAERDRSISTANTIDSLLRAERSAQDRLATQVRTLEADNLALRNDLGFYERLLPAQGGEGPTVRAFQADAATPGKLRYRLLVMQAAQAGRSAADFNGRYEITLAGALDDAPWTQAHPGGAQPLQLKQVLRVEGSIDHPASAVIKTATVRILDGSGAVRATQSAKVVVP
jgi:hypothetical protein